MPQSVKELIDVLDVVEEAPDQYSGRQPGNPNIARVFGGQVLAQALAAATRTVPGDRPVHSLHSYFLLGGDPAVPITYRVERVRDGRSFATRTVKALQHGNIIFTMTASFHREEPGLDHQITMTRVPPPEDLPRLSSVIEDRSGVNVEFWEQAWAALEIRHVMAEDGPERTPAQKVWFKVKEPLGGDQALQRCALTYLSDLTLLSAALVRHGYLLGAPEFQRASLDHAVWFHADVKADEWLLYDQISPWAGGARGFTRANVFNQAGILVASTSQEGLIRPVAAVNGRSSN